MQTFLVTLLLWLNAFLSTGIFLANATVIGTQPTAQPTVTSSCASDDAAFDFKYDLSGDVSLYWSIDDAGDLSDDAAFYPALRAKLVSHTGGWASIGFSSKGLMIGTDAIVGQPGVLPQKYFLSAKASSGVQATGSQTLLGTSVVADADGSVSWEYVKSLKEDGEIEIGASGSAWGSVSWATGSGSISYHGSRGAVELDFATCGAKAIKLKAVNSNAIKTHGMCMIAAWAYLAPFATVSARSKHSKLTPGKVWLYIHIVMQITALIVTAVGVSKAIIAIDDADGVDHFTGRHPWLGITVLVLVLVQVLMGTFRPHAQAAGKDKTVARFIFEIAHRVVGVSVLILGAVTLYSGVKTAFFLVHIDQVQTWNTAIIAPLSIAVALMVFLTVYINFIMSKAAVEDVPTPKAAVADEASAKKEALNSP